MKIVKTDKRWFWIKEYEGKKYTRDYEYTGQSEDEMLEIAQKSWKRDLSLIQKSKI